MICRKPPWISVNFIIPEKLWNRTIKKLSLIHIFLFLGIFLGTMFMMATVLIIYYKQISEGYDDHERFEIMQKVGMSSREAVSYTHLDVYKRQAY